MKSKAELIGNLSTLMERLEKFGVDIEGVEKIEFRDGKEIIHGTGWILCDCVMLKKPDLSNPKVKEHVHSRMKELSPIAKKILGKE